MNDLKQEIDDLQLSLIPILNHIGTLKKIAPSIFCYQFSELEDKIIEIKRIIGALRTSILPWRNK